MTAQDKIESGAPVKEAPIGLALLREPFPPHHISKLPKPTKAQTDAVRQDFKKGIRCKLCGQWHHPEVVHLDYVGHAALTDRLLDCDPLWSWEPMAFTPEGAPALDRDGGMWIKLTVCGHTRLGYGHPDGKTGGNAIKETIGDALRNAAMRFGAALDLWHKGELHAADDAEEAQEKPAPDLNAMAQRLIRLAQNAKTLAHLDDIWKGEVDVRRALSEAEMLGPVSDAFGARKRALLAAADIDDHIPYEGAAQ